MPERMRAHRVGPFSLPRPRRLPAVAALLLALSAVACGGSQQDALNKRISRLQDELTAVQATNDRLEERLVVLEARAATGRSEPRRDEPAAKHAPKPEPEEVDSREPVERPRLKVIRVVPGDESLPAAAPADEDEAEKRPVIRQHGQSPKRGVGDDGSAAAPRTMRYLDRLAERRASEEGGRNG